jgi:hypothetical protein
MNNNLILFQYDIQLMHEFILFTKVHSNFIHQISFTKFNDKVISFMSISSCVNRVGLKALWLFNANIYNVIRGWWVNELVMSQGNM